MPLPMVHLSVAKKITDKCVIQNPADFYLGSIAPDGVHMRENYGVEYKKRSHLWNPDGTRCENDVIEFLRCHIDDNDTKTFYLGYAVHVLTDILWGKNVYSNFLKKYKADTTPVQDERWAYYNDTDRLDFELYKNLPYREEIWDLLKDVKAVDTSDLVTAAEIDAWNDRTLHWYDSGESEHKNPIKYITYEDVLSFIDEAGEEIFNLIEAYI